MYVSSILLLSLAFVASGNVLMPPSLKTVLPNPTWPITCAFRLYENRRPDAPSYAGVPTVTYFECQILCLGQKRCGMYMWYKSSSSSHCYFFQHSSDLFDEAGLPVHSIVYATSTKYHTGSKHCKAHTIARECDDFPVYTNRKYPSSGQITYIRSGSYPVITPNQCREYCKFFQNCKRVKYEVRSSTDIYCFLYDYGSSTTTCSSSYTTCGTYERYCKDIPYDPDTYSPPATKPPPVVCPTELISFDGWTTCLPVGHPQQECDAIEGCCYLEMFFTGFCVKPVGAGEINTLAVTNQNTSEP